MVKLLLTRTTVRFYEREGLLEAPARESTSYVQNLCMTE